MPPTRYATFGYAAPLDSDATTIEYNDTLFPTAGGDQFAVTDVQRSVTEAVAETVEAGQTTEVGGDRVATVTDVEREPTGDDRVKITLGAELAVWDRPSGPAFGGQPLRIDHRMTLVTDAVLVSGSVTAIDTDVAAR